MKTLFLISIIIFVFYSCRDAKDDSPERIVHEWNFNDVNQGWGGGFADYPIERDEFYELEFVYENLPAPLDTSRGALKLSGSNRSDDLFMFVYRRITGLVPGKVYKITFFVEFASNVADNMVGIGGSPGESVYVKAGATVIEPSLEIDEMNYHRMNIDIGNQSQSGDDMIVIGDFSNDTSQEVYTLKTVSNNDEFTVRTNDTGELWIIVGTDSGFEGTTTIYYNSVRVEMFY